MRMISHQDEDNKSPGFAVERAVDPIYAKYRNGQREPSEPFLRASSRRYCESRFLALESQDGRLEKALVFGDIWNAIYIPEGSDQKLCLYILDDQSEDLTSFAVISKLISHLYRSKLYGTLRKGRVYKTNRKGEDNRFT